MRIDVHGHWLPESYIEQAAAAGVRRADGALHVGEETIVGPGVSPDLLQGSDDPADWLAEMDRRQVDHLIVSPSPLLYLYSAPADVAVPFCTFKNDAIRAFTSAHPDRLSWVAALPLQDPAASVAEARRAADLGARGVHVATSELGPYELDSEELWPLYEVLEQRGLPLTVHPNPFAGTLAVRSSYVLNVFPGYLHQETLAFTRLALGGVFDDFPELLVYLTHGGGAVPYQFGRLAVACNPAFGVRAKRPLAEYLPNFYFDLLLEDVAARQFLRDFMGDDRLVVGDNFGAIDHVDGFGELEECGFPDETVAKIAATNGAALFGLNLAGHSEKTGPSQPSAKDALSR